MVSREREAAVINGIGLETERKPSVGVALAIVGIDPSRNGENITSPMLWTVIEKKNNPKTEKIAGQISFPGETSKRRESLNVNILGAVVEEFSRDDQIANNLWFVPGKSHIENRILISGRPADLVVLPFTGSLKAENIPFAQDEVAPNKWMTVEDILYEDPDRVRKFTRELLALEQGQRLIGQVIDSFIRFPLSRVSLSRLLPDDCFSMTQFYMQRRERHDVSISNIPARNN